MTKVPQGFDFSFLNDEEARKILQVLERNEELQRADKDRISKLQKTKRDIRWLQGVTGEWFEEIQRKKFCNETDVSQMLKQPLTYRLREGMAENDRVELQTSRSKTTPHQRNPMSVSSRLSFRSFSSLFSFRKSRRETSKLLSPAQKGGGLSSMSVSVPVPPRAACQEVLFKQQAKIYSSSVENRPADSVFVPGRAGMREGSGMPPWDASQLENEFFQVLDDLDNKLAQEQCPSSGNTTAPLNYGSRAQCSHFYSRGNTHGNITGRYQNHHNGASNMSIYDILRPGTPREGFKTFSPRTKTIYDMYRTREPRLSKEDYVQKNSFGSTSLCFDSRQPSTSPATIYFTTRSLHFPTITQNKSGFIPPRHQQSPKRTPLSSIIWNRSDTSGGRQSHEEFLGAPSPMEIDSADQYVYPRCFQENRRYEFYRSQSVYQGVHLDTYMDNAMSPDPFENSENMPFYHQEHPFARPFSSNTFGRNREQRFKQSPLWGQHEEHSFWSDFPQSRHPFTSHRDSEMISMEVAAGHSHSIHSQHWGPFSPGYKTNIFRGHEEPHLWQFDSQTTTLESTEVSRGNESQTTHFSMPNVCPGTGPSYHSTSGRSACQQGGPPTEVHLDKEPYSFGNTQTTLAYSFSTSFPPIPDDRGNPQRPSFQDPTVAVHKIKPASLPIKSYTEVTVTKSDSVDSPPLTESPPSILVTQVTKEKVLKESLREEDKQLHKMDRTHMTSEVPQPVSQTVTSNHASDVQNPLSQDSAEGKGFAFNASTTVSSKRSPGVISRKESPKIHISHRERSNELKKDKNHTGDRKLGSATSLAFVQERTTASWPSPDQGCHQEVRASTEAISGIIKNNHWSSGPADGQKAQSAEKPAISDTKEEQGTTSPSTNCSKPAARRKIPRDSSDLSSGILPGSSPSNNSFLDTPAIPSTTVFSRKSPSGKDPSPGERAQKDNDSKDQSDQFALSPSENPKRNDECVLVHNEAVDVAKWRSPSPFKDGKGKGKVRRRIASLEKLSKMERRSAPTSDNSSSMEMNQSNSKPPEVHTTSCTSPTKSARFLINNRKSESKIMASPCRNEPLPFQVKNNVEHPAGKYTLNKFGPTSSESESKCSKAVSDSVPVAPEATEKVTNLKNIGFASVRKGPLPFLIKRAVSCPSGVPDASDGRDKREECLVSNTDDSAVTLKPWEAIISPLENNSPVSDLSWPKRHHQKQYFPECTEKDGKIAASGTGLFSLSNEDPLPFSSDASRKESGKTLRKFKTTSTFSVSGDEDNVKCLEVVSVYYTLPRKYSKKFSNILEKYTRYIDSLTESTKVETETFPNAFEKEKLNYSTQEQSGTPSSEGLKMLVTSAQEKTHCLSHTSENMTVSQLPSLWPSEPTLQEVDSTEARVSLHKRESKTGGISPDNFAKTPLGDSESRKERGKRSQSETLPPSSMLQEKKVTEEKAENCQQSSKSGNSGPSNLPAHSEENVGSSQNGRSSGECVGTRIAITAPGIGEGLPREIADGSSNGLQPSQVRGEIGTDFQKETSKPLSDLESQVFALTPALHKLQLFEGTCSGEPDLDSLQSEPRELPPRSQEISMTENSKAEDEMLKLAWDQPSFPGGNSKQKTSLDDPEKGKNRSVVKHRLAAMSKASRKFPAKDLSPRRHVATIFPQSGNSSGFGSLSLGTAECNLPSPEPTPKSIESRNESRLSCDITDVEKSENSLQVPVIPSREASTHLSNPKSNSISQLQQNGDKNISESSPKYEKSKDVTAAQTLERESRTLAQPTFPNLGEADFSDHQRRINPPFPLEPTEKSRLSIPLASYQQQQRSASSLEWGPELHPYRSNSLKSINVHGDLVRKSHPPKVRGRHFSESTSIDNALSELTLGDEFSGNSGYSRRFSSFSELSSCDGNENRILGGGRTKMGPKFATSISRPIDYGIFGKEQQLAFLENVKRSLTQGRLWKPSFLKNPGFLKDDVINHPQPTELPSSDSPSGQMPEDALSPGAPLCIYEKTPVDSDCDTDTTTDDEYYLDENDKESEL